MCKLNQTPEQINNMQKYVRGSIPFFFTEFQVYCLPAKSI